MRTRNPIVRDLRTPKYRKRVVQSKKIYTRSFKHRKKIGGYENSADFFGVFQDAE